MKHVVVIGGGISGLAAANRILELAQESKKSLRLTLLEASSALGGIVRTHERDGFLLESGPDAFISEKPAALELVRRLGLESHLLETNKNFRRSFIVNRSRLLPVPEGFQLLAPAKLSSLFKSNIFSWPGKARVAFDLLLPRRVLNGSGEDDESLASFVRRRLGREALERMAQPMIGGIYTADPEQLSLRATMPRFLELEQEHRSVIRGLQKQRGENEAASGARYSLFLSFDRGMQLLTDKLVEQVSNFRPGAGDNSAPSIKTNTSVESLALANQHWTVKTQAGNLDADAICLAVPAYVSAGLLKDIDTTLASELERISYASSATINLAYRREDVPHPLDGFGFVVPFVEKRTLMACTFSSVKFSGRAPDGHVLLRAFVGGALQPETAAMDETELMNGVSKDLRDLLGIQKPPLFTEITRWSRSMPQYNLGHLTRVARIDERVGSLPALALAGNAFRGIGVPDCIRSGEAAAASLVAGL